MSETAKKWTYREVVTSKFLLIVLVTVLFTNFSTAGINKVMTHKEVMDNGVVYAQNFFLPKLGQLGLAVVIFMLVTFCFQYFINKTKSVYISVDKRNEFKWYSVYSVVVGACIYYYTTKLLYTMTVWQLGFLLAFLFSVVIGVLLHIGMLGLTKMNKQLITRIENGAYDQDLKDDVLKAKVMKVLNRGHVSSVKSAVIYVQARGFIYKTITFLVKAFWWLLVFLWAIIPVIGNKGRGSYRPTYPNITSKSDTSKEDKQQAEYKARQDQKQANYSFNQAKKQTLYNSNYDDVEWNRYIHDQRQANQAKKDARKMSKGRFSFRCIF